MLSKSILAALVAAYLALVGVEATTLTCQQMQALSVANFPAEYVTDMICIAQKESSWNPSAKNPSSSATGLWQCLASHCGELCKCTGPADLMNPTVNAECAAAILKAQGLNAWTTWSSGLCKGWNSCVAPSSSSSSSASASSTSSGSGSSSSGSGSGSSTSGSGSSGSSGSSTSGSGSSSGSGSGSGSGSTMI